ETVLERRRQYLKQGLLPKTLILLTFDMSRGKFGGLVRVHNLGCAISPCLLVGLVAVTCANKRLTQQPTPLTARARSSHCKSPLGFLSPTSTSRRSIRGCAGSLPLNPRPERVADGV